MSTKSQLIKVAIISLVLAVGLGIAKFVVMFSIYGLAGSNDQQAASQKLDHVVAVMHVLAVLSVVAAMISLLSLVLEFIRASRK